MVSGLEKGCEGANGKRGAESGIEPEVVFRLRTRGVALGVIEATPSNHVGLCVRSRKREYQIEESPYDSEVGGATADRNGPKPKGIVDAIDTYTDWKIGRSKRQCDNSVVASLLRVAQFPNWDGGAPAYAESVSPLAEGLARQR